MAASSGGMLVCTHGWLSTSAAVMRCPGSTVSIFCTSPEQLLDTCTIGAARQTQRAGGPGLTEPAPELCTADARTGTLIIAHDVGQAPPFAEVFGDGQQADADEMAHRGWQRVEIAGHDAGEHGLHALDVRECRLLRRQELQQEAMGIRTTAVLIQSASRHPADVLPAT